MKSRYAKTATIWGILNLSCFFSIAAVQGSELDSLKILIRSLQSEIEQKQAVIARLSEEFTSMNVKIYEYKAEQNNGVNPFSHLRMQNALKTSHQLADSLDSINKQLRESKSKLQQVYSTAIQKIEEKIQHELSLAKDNSQNRSQQKKQLNDIRKLENEKADYAARLQTLKVDEGGWEKIEIEPEDNRRRLKLKAALLEDFLRNLTQSVRSLESELEKNRSDRKTYMELRDFYKELAESLDDDQDIFDRNRVEELRDKLEALDREFGRLKQQMNVLNRDITILKAKIELFNSAITEKESL
jgi:DNA repair exonuclease SbcCD ATPase subunit